MYQNVLNTVILLDIPLSIAHGQRSKLPVVAAIAPNQPYLSTEPKGSKRVAILRTTPEEEILYHEKLQLELAIALQEVKQNFRERKWSVPRHPTSEPGGTKVMPCSHDSSVAASAYSDMTNLNESLNEAGPPGLVPPLILSDLENKICSLSTLRHVMVSNPGASGVKLNASHQTFFIPSHCKFFLSSIEHGSLTLPSLAESFLPASRAHPEAGKFDLILLDPPWPNRSVRNAKTYYTAERHLVDHPFYQTLPVIQKHLSSRGIVAIWITNKAAIRSSVLESMNVIGLELKEEWIWLKTTVDGEPVTALDGLWRRPYEVLLVFRRLNNSKYQTGYTDCVKRRVIIAVPDFHSRKPCLEELLRPLLPDSYRAMEIFARYLTAGWWSWGDDVLKFQGEDCWVRAEE